MQKKFTYEVAIKQDGFTEWWTISLEIDYQVCTPSISYGGIVDPSPPVEVFAVAVPIWAEWIKNF